MNIKDIYDLIDSIAPYNTQCEWDNSGLNIGSFSDEVKSVMVALDCTNDVIKQAAEKNCELVVCHHPIIFGGVKSIETDSPVYNAISNNMSVLSAHTNVDMAKGGVNDVLCDILGIADRQVLIAEGRPFMRMGSVENMTVFDFSKEIAKKLKTYVNTVDGEKTVSKVAVCGGAGGEYIKEAAEAGCDTFITGEVKHHEYLNAENCGINLIVAGHYATEEPVVDVLYNKIAEAFPTLNVYKAKNECSYVTIGE